MLKATKRHRYDQRVKKMTRSTSILAKLGKSQIGFLRSSWFVFALETKLNLKASCRVRISTSVVLSDVSCDSYSQDLLAKGSLLDVSSLIRWRLSFSLPSASRTASLLVMVVSRLCCICVKRPCICWIMV